MLENSKAFSGFSVDDLQKAKKFYTETLGLTMKDMPMGTMELQIKGNNAIAVYPKPNHEPATFTILNFPVDDIDKTVDELTAKGVVFERYEGQIETDEKGIHRGKGEEPTIAWFKDPAGNILSVIELK